MLDSNESILIGDVTLKAPLGRVVIGDIELQTIAKRRGKVVLNIYAPPGFITCIERVTQPAPQLVIHTAAKKTLDAAAQPSLGFGHAMALAVA